MKEFYFYRKHTYKSYIVKIGRTKEKERKRHDERISTNELIAGNYESP